MRRPLCLLCLFYVLAVTLIMELFPPKDEQKVLPRDGSYDTCIGKVYRIEFQKDKSVLYLKSNSEKILCYFPNDSFTSGLKIGNAVRVTGKVRLFENASNEGQFDAKMYYGILGMDFAMTGCEGIIADKGYDFYKDGLYRIRRRISQSFQAGLPEEYAGIMQAMLLGEKGNMDQDIKGLYQRNGIAHVLAISGLHITFLGMGLFKLCRKVRLPYLAGSLLSLALIISFGEMTRSGASTIRSIVMFSLFLLAGICGSTYDMLTAMAISAAGLLVYQPRYVYHSGFLLSFGSVMGIALISPLLREIFPQEPLAKRMLLNKSRREKLLDKWKDQLFSSLSASLGVTFATLPIQLYFFYTFPVYSILLNLLIIPLMGALMMAGVFGGIGACIFAWGSVFFLMPCKWILEFYEWLCRGFDRLPGGHLILGRPALWKILFYYGVLWCILLWEYYGRRKKETVIHTNHTAGAIKAVLAMTAVLVLCVRWRAATTCTMLDIGQGDCLVVEEKSGANILIDGGSSDVSQVGKYRIVPYLKSHGISKIDYAFISHGDKDHTSGVLEILLDRKELEIEIGCLVLTKFAMTDEVYEELLSAAKQSNTRVLLIGSGDRFTRGETEITCMYPAMEDEASGNDQSMVLVMECGGIKTLFTGDLTEEKEWVVKWEDVDVLKVAHHGSRYSTGIPFLEQCRPETAIISAGEKNSYGHPHGETLERLEQYGIKTFLTAEKGAITIRYGKGKYSVLTHGKM